MGTVVTPHYSIECNGPAPVPTMKRCPSVAKGGWVQEEVEAAAVAKGWTLGNKALCPMCAPEVDVAPKVKPVRAPRGQQGPEQTAEVTQ